MQYFEQSNENMEVELQLIIVLLSFYSARQRLYMKRRIRRNSASMKRTAKKSFNRYYCKSDKGFKTLNNLFD